MNTTEMIKVPRTAHKWGQNFLILFYCASAVNIVLGGNALIGLLLAVFLFLLAGYDEFVFAAPLMLIANDALGTVVAGRISFPLMYFALMGLRFLRKERKEISKRGLFRISICLLLAGHLYIFQVQSISGMFSTFIYMMIVCNIAENTERNEKIWNPMLLAMGIGCFILAGQLLFFGGVAYVELETQTTALSSLIQMRYGMVGTGIGDPNYSGLKLLLGCLCIYYSKINKFLRSGMLVIMFIAMVKTVSITTVLILIMVIFIGTLLHKGVGRKIKYGLLILLILGMSVYILVSTPIEYLPSGIQTLLLRIYEKISQFAVGNIREFTTGRSYRALSNLEYAFNRVGIKWFLGGEAIPPDGLLLSHNTYVDLLVRFGLIGFLCIMARVLYCALRQYKNCAKNNYSKERVCLLQIKLIYIAFSFSLSIYIYQEAAWWILFLLFI